ncbi:hypothetical protein [Microseira sp. BLCC-F43]|jgi:uncharacterized protein (DUF433 family)
MTTTAVSKYVTRNRDILSGEPIIIGTRISLRIIEDNNPGIPFSDS